MPALTNFSKTHEMPHSYSKPRVSAQKIILYPCTFFTLGWITDKEPLTWLLSLALYVF